jgi:hypothetical protein
LVVSPHALRGGTRVAAPRRIDSLAAECPLALALHRSPIFWELIMSTNILPEISAPQSAALKINLFSQAGRYLTSEPVTEMDLTGLRSEAWFEAFLRKGMADVPFAGVEFRLVPLLKADSDSVCAGFALEANSPRGKVARCEFHRRALLEVASRAADRLVQLGVFEAGDQYYFEIAVDAEPRREAALETLTTKGRVSVKTPSLHFLSASLRTLLEQGRAVGDQDEEAFHVFFTEAALAAAEKYSRQGASQPKAIETGAALGGFLGLGDDRPTSGDFFLIVTDVLEAVQSAGTEFSLTYTSESWNRISRILSARQAAQPAFRLCGSAHGHNFSPGEPCEACFKTAAPCGTHNVAPSSADLLWTQSVFAHQPWALCHIFGRNARGEALSGLFSLRQNRLHRRGFFLLPSFEPERWKMICPTDLNPT